MNPIVLAALLAVGLGVPACDDQSEDDNPDPGHIEGRAGDARIALTPRGDPGDLDNLTWAVDNVAPGGTVSLGAGRFFLGDGDASPKETVVIRRPLSLVGQGTEGASETRIEGGGAMLPWGISGFELESGPFRIENDQDAGPVVFEAIRFTGWTAHVVVIAKCHGFTIRRCRIDHPVAGTPIGGVSAVHALFSSGPYAEGDFVAEDNQVELGGYDGGQPDDEQFLGIFFSYHDQVRVTGNTITGLDEGIEIIGNRHDLSVYDMYPDFPAPGPGLFEMVVADNTVDVTQIFDDAVWPGKVGILVAGNEGVSAVRIENNDVTIRGTDHGYAFALSGAHLTVRDNTGHLEAYEGTVPGGAFLIGFAYAFEPFWPTNGGPSLIDSVIEQNRFTGTAAGPAVYFYDVTDPFEDLPRLFYGTVPNASHGNRIDLGDSVAALGAPITLAIPPGVYDNDFAGDTGTVLDLSPPGANRY